jgi:hypothetical protein
MKQERHVTGIGEKINADRVWLESLKERGLTVSGRIILKCILEEGGGQAGTGFVCLRIRASGQLF